MGGENVADLLHDQIYVGREGISTSFESDNQSESFIYVVVAILPLSGKS